MEQEPGRLSLITDGCYSVGEVESLTGVPRVLSRRFIKLYKGRFGLWGGGEQRLANSYYVTFRDLLELRYIHAFHEAGVTWQRIRRTAEYAGKRFKTDFPFSDVRFKTDGAEIFAATDDGLEAVSRYGQLVFEEILGERLFSPLDYENNVPVRWYPAEEWGMLNVGRAVMVDPRISFGVPVVVDCHIPTETLYLSVLAEGMDFEVVARHYEVSSESVRYAVAFQEEKAHRRVLSGT